MNTGQSLLTIGAMLLLSILILRVNNTFLSTGTVISQSKLGMIASSIANSKLDEIKTKAFDEYTVSNVADQLSDLEPPNSLNKETGETYPNFDDVDDFNKFARDDTIQVDPGMKPEIFHDSCSVVYVSSSNPDAAYTASSTWNKKITVFVTHKLMSDTIKMSTIYSYWDFK